MRKRFVRTAEKCFWQESMNSCARSVERKGRAMVERKVRRGERMSHLKITRCKGEGQGSCKMCMDNGKWNTNWMRFLYEIEGYEGCYCSECAKKIETSERYKQGITAREALEIGKEISKGIQDGVASVYGDTNNGKEG